VFKIKSQKVANRVRAWGKYRALKLLIQGGATDRAKGGGWISLMNDNKGGSWRGKTTPPNQKRNRNNSKRGGKKKQIPVVLGAKSQKCGGQVPREKGALGQEGIREVKRFDSSRGDFRGGTGVRAGKGQLAGLSPAKVPRTKIEIQNKLPDRGTKACFSGRAKPKTKCLRLETTH